MKAEEAAEPIGPMQCGAAARESLRSTNLDDEYQRINNEFYGSSLRTVAVEWGDLSREGCSTRFGKVSGADPCSKQSSWLSGISSSSCTDRTAATDRA
jgi:hypothetical protein